MKIFDLSVMKCKKLKKNLRLSTELAGFLSWIWFFLFWTFGTVLFFFYVLCFFEMNFKFLGATSADEVYEAVDN